MLSSFLLSFFRINLSKLKFHRHSSFFEIISITISFVIYFFTSRAFSLGDNVFGIEGLNYFEFVILGDLALMFPLYFIEAPMRNLKEAIDTKVLNTLILLKRNIVGAYISISYNDIIRVVLRFILSLIIIFLLFGSSLSLSHILSIIKLILLSLPFSLAIGLLFGFILLYFGRGSFLLGYVSVFISVFSGAFFPVSVLPPSIMKFTSSLIPLTVLLSDVRGESSLKVGYFQFLFWIFILVLTFKAIRFGVRKYCERGLNIVRL